MTGLDQDVAGLDVAMNHSATVRELEAIGYFGGQP